MLTFSDLYQKYAPEVYRFAFWLSHSRPEAEDITSETFVRAWVRRSTIRTETLKAYLLTIARNLYLERQRGRKRQVPLENDLPDGDPGPEARAQYLLELQAIARLLSTVPEADRSAFILRVQFELPYAEISRVLGVSEVTARVKVHRVRRKILQAMVEKEFLE